MIEAFASVFIQEVATTRRGDIVRLVVAEGPRFPDIADFYYREVVSRGLGGMRALIELGVARGEIKQKNLARFPQILVAPAIVAVIWQSLFSRHAPLDANEMFRVHLDLIFANGGRHDFVAQDLFENDGHPGRAGARRRAERCNDRKDPAFRAGSKPT